MDDLRQERLSAFVLRAREELAGFSLLDDRALVHHDHAIAEPAVAAIEAAGFAVEKVPALSEAVGHAQSIRIDGGGFLAGSDPRADGSAVVL
jgi:gamma-glutamyltranspeptidase